VNNPPVEPLTDRKPVGATDVRTHRFAGVPFRGFILWMVVLLCIFSLPLWRLARYAAGSDLNSHVLLVPVIVAYLIWLKRHFLAAQFAGKKSFGDATRAGRIPGVTFLAFGAGFGVYYAITAWRRPSATPEDLLAVAMVSFVCAAISGAFFFFGKRVIASVAFPVFFGFFLVPFPTFLTIWLETFLQHASADAASALFTLSGSSVLRDGLVFRLPGISLEVARECSGIHSTLVLFITSLLAGHLLLRTGWKKGLLALVVIPLGILRNGCRIFTLGYLCVHLDPGIIDSPLHHRGGPIFFVLSLVPFFALLLLLRRSEDHNKEGKIKNSIVNAVSHDQDATEPLHKS